MPQFGLARPRPASPGSPASVIARPSARIAHLLCTVTGYGDFPSVDLSSLIPNGRWRLAYERVCRPGRQGFGGLPLCVRPGRVTVSR